MDTERNEDLNPHGEDLEEKVRQMLDPSIPDKPNKVIIDKTDSSDLPDRIVVINSSLDSKNPDTDKSEQTAESSDKPPSKIEIESAVRIPTAPLPPSEKPAKKIITPISISSGEDDVPVDPLMEISKIEPSKIALSNKEKMVKPVNKIDVKDDSETPTDISNKLDQTAAAIIPVDKPSKLKKSKSKTTKTSKAKPEVVVDEPASEPETIQTEDDPKLEAESMDNLNKEIGELIDAGNQSNDEIDIKDPDVITDPKTDKAIAEIVASESDEILEIEDAVRDSDAQLKPSKKPKQGLLRKILKIVKKPIFKWIIIFLTLVLALFIAAVPTARYFVLNTAGVRVSSTVKVLDDSTSQPLKNVTVTIGGVEGSTDNEGIVTLSKIKLGNTKLSVTKRAFAPVDKNVTLGWGSNPLGDISLTPTGTQYSFVISDFLSGEPLDKVQANSGVSDAQSDKDGILKLTIDKPEDNDFQVTLTLDGYRDEVITINPEDKSVHDIKLVTGRRHVYVSKRSGKFDIYSAYIDGKEEKVVLAASGNEQPTMVLVPHSTENIVAYVSTRAGQNNADGYTLSNLLIIDLDDNDTTNIALSEQIKIISWVGDKLVYVQISAGESENTPERYKLFSYNYKESTTKELAKSNFFNDVMGMGNSVFYAPSSALQTGPTNFYKVNIDNGENQIIHDKEVWNIIRTGYDQLVLSVQQQWYEFRLTDKTPVKLNTAPANQLSRVYADSPDSKLSAWIDSRDGKGVIVLYDTLTKTEKTIKTENGITTPLYWLNNQVIVYRLKSNQETADYAININGGEATKISDVTDSKGLVRWQY